MRTHDARLGLQFLAKDERALQRLDRSFRTSAQAQRFADVGQCR
jgi:hypothetical protein